jgi:hypothetical protein
MNMQERRKRALPGSYEKKRSTNRRAFPRWMAPFEVRVVQDKQTLSCEPLEIGEGGMSFACNGTFEKETNIVIEFRLVGSSAPTDWVRVKVQVRHVDFGKIGVEFLNLRMADRLRLLDHVSAVK